MNLEDLTCNFCCLQLVTLVGILHADDACHLLVVLEQHPHTTFFNSRIRSQTEFFFRKEAPRSSLKIVSLFSGAASEWMAKMIIRAWRSLLLRVALRWWPVIVRQNPHCPFTRQLLPHKRHSFEEQVHYTVCIKTDCMGAFPIKPLARRSCVSLLASANWFSGLIACS